MDRLEELRSHAILDTDPEVEMDEIAQMANAIFNTPISVVSFIDDRRQWYKAKLGVKWSEVPLEDTFCRFTLDQPEDVLLILDPQHDERVSQNPYVLAEDGIRFYVSAPIVSSLGNVLGTVCTWDSEAHEVHKSQLEALRLLAKRVSISLETRKILRDQNKRIELFGEKLKNLTELSPGALFKIITDPWTKELSLDFLGGGISRLIPNLSQEEILENPAVFIRWVHPKFRVKLFRKFINSTKNSSSFEMDIPVQLPGQKRIWLWIKARPEFEGGKINFYGTIQDVSQKIAHLKSLKKFLFDISHKLRAPVAKMKGVLHLISDENTPENTLELTPFLFQSAEELDQVLFQLNHEYSNLVSGLEEDH
ncbi:GAF domain-containing protein [Algoriphagus sanaruensis]|uniref:GAF domain-containing protein n=1 Tax=Algoriphagus sanaruensis TaxID=1727163 RepID=A0A142EPT0_9BACT|nr:GAF domain-containing protein [Algoriphagus sanaruensis]AMQ57135.1 hypothetical protein AO498_11860 [Algoriphagus sanaruensis]